MFLRSKETLIKNYLIKVMSILIIGIQIHQIILTDVGEYKEDLVEIIL